MVSVCLANEVGAIPERFDAVELVLHQAVDGLDVGLEAMCAGRNGFVTLAGDGLDCPGEGARIFCLPGADEFRAVVRLPGGAPEFNAAFFEVLDNLCGEHLGACEAQLVGVSEV